MDQAFKNGLDLLCEVALTNTDLTQYQVGVALTPRHGNAQNPRENQPVQREAQAVFPQVPPENKENVPPEQDSPPKKRRRKNFSPPQRRFLLAAYRIKRYPSAEEKEYIADAINLTTDQVQQWFENARRRNYV